MPHISAMDNCQPQQSIEPSSIASQEGQEMTSEGQGTTSSSTENDATPKSGDSEETVETKDNQSPSGKPKGKKRKSYVPEITSQKKTIKTDEILLEIKETVGKMNSDNSSKDFLDFLKAESKRQAERDNAFLKLLGSMMQPQPQPQINMPQNFIMPQSPHLPSPSFNVPPNTNYQPNHFPQQVTTPPTTPHTPAARWCGWFLYLLIALLPEKRWPR